MIEIVMQVDDEFWNILKQFKEFKGQKVLIHCKDCKYQEQFGDREEYWCKINEHWKRSQEFDEVVADTYWDADDFCSRGEKK